MTTEVSLQTNTSWPIYGHIAAIHRLQRAITPALEYADTSVQGKGLRHAYLFLGPRHVGKTTVARTFAQALLCRHSQERPCQICRSCRLMQTNRHPDFRLISPLDKEGNIDRDNGMLRVDQATELVREAALSPVESRYKLFLIQDMQTANDNFANKLLKTIEEPPEHVVLCISASDRSGVLPTVVSRCQLVELQLLGASTIAQALCVGWQGEPEQAHLLAKLAGGRLGWAVERLTNETLWQERSELLQELWDLIDSNRLQRLAFAEKLASKRDEKRIFNMLEVWTAWWRDVLLVQSGCADSCSNIDCMGQIEQHAAHISAGVVQQYMNALQRIERYLQHTTNLRLALDVLLLKLPYLSMDKVI